MLKKSKSVVKIVEHSGKFRVTLDESVIQHWFSIEAARPFSFFRATFLSLGSPGGQEANVDGSHVHVLGLLQRAIQVNMASF